MSSVFLNTFGGSAVSPADVSYAAYSFSGPLVLYWPQFSAGQTDVCARFMNLTATATSLNVYMPDATLTSVGQDVIIFNAGSNTFSVVDFNGGAIATIAAGQTYYLMLNNNATQAGTWQTVQFGVGTGSASAAALAGAGLLATAGMLNVNLNATTINASTTLTGAARAILQVWNGGSGVIILPTASSVGDGFFFPFANDGSGSATITPSGGDQIDGASTSVFTQTQSAFIVSSGTAWYTVGKGTQTNFAVTLLNLNVAGSSDVTETSAQAQNVIQQFTGALAGNINVIVPATVQLYYIFNNTSGAYTLTVKTAGGTGIAVDQGSHTILYCDGTNVVNAFTSSFGGAISISAGSATAPNFSFVGSLTTGIYSPASNQLAITANGKEVSNFISDASAVNYLQLESTATANAPIISAQGADTNIGIILSPKGSGAIGIGKIIVLGGAIDGTIVGGATPAAITGTTITANTGFVGNLTGNITGTAPAGTLTGSTLAAGVINSSLTSVGTVTSGTWSGLFGAVTGANLTNLTAANISAGTAGISITGNAATATKLATGRTISVTGDLAYTSPAFDGSTNITGAGTLATVNSNVGSFSNASITVNGKGLITAASNGTSAIAAIRRQVFLNSATYTPDLHLVYCDIRAIGGGAGGGGASASSGAVAGGGAAGSEASLICSSATIGASKAITIGAGGAAGANTGGTGGTGGTTTVGALISALGGLGGVGSTAAASLGGAGQAATGGDFNGTGAPGGNGFGNQVNTVESSGYGASTSLGGGALGQVGSTPNNGVNGVDGTGGGGSGANAGTGTAKIGGTGGKGIVIITEYCSQ